MNNKPHLHRLDICEGDHKVRVTYGDTRVVVNRHWWQKKVSEARIKVAVEKAIRQHDEGTLRNVRLAEIIQPINELVKRDSWGSESGPEKWGTDILSDIRKVSM